VHRSGKSVLFAPRHLTSITHCRSRTVGMLLARLIRGNMIGRFPVAPEAGSPPTMIRAGPHHVRSGNYSDSSGVDYADLQPTFDDL
jgi:hypothetical protein